jgi:hypothetical protein
MKAWISDGLGMVRSVSMNIAVRECATVISTLKVTLFINQLNTNKN